MGLLLYDGPGFVRSLTTILTVEGAAFAAGLWSAPRPGPDLVHRLRRRWLLCLMAYLTAAGFGTVWSLVPALGDARLGQGLGLAILGGLPLYAAGGVIGGIGTSARTDPGGRLRGPGASAATGAALGFVLTGFLLPRAPMPGSLLVLCLVMLSLGGMTFGSVLGARLQIDVLGRRPARGGDVRVEDRRLPVDGLRSRFLLEGPHVRRETEFGKDGETPWDVAVVRALMPEAEAGWRVLLLGGGASVAPRTILREHPTGVADVIERTGAVIELGREFFDTDLAIARGERLRVEVGHFDDRLEGVTPGYDLVLIDTAALAPVGGVNGLSRRSRTRLKQLVAPGGVVTWGPLPSEPGLPEVPDGWTLARYRSNGGRLTEEHILMTRPGPDDRDVVVAGFEAESAGASVA
jgi:hypothetical protein